MEYLSSDKIAIIDLTSSEILEEDLPEEQVEENIGGVGITTALYKRFEGEDPIVLGAGLLTGTLVPGAALSVMTAKSPVSGKISHIPVTLHAGMELKYSGFDYIVIKGSSSKPVFLWIHDGIVDIEDAGDLWGKDTWASTDHIRVLMGDNLIQVLGIGKAGERGSDLSQVCINYWASGDRAGLGALFGRKNLKLIAIRGMGLLEIADPEEFVETCAEFLDDVREGEWAGKSGITKTSALLGGEDISAWLDPLVHRHMACFNTPLATNSFVFLDEDPGLLKESASEEPGFLVNDMGALLAFKGLGLSASDACSVMKACAKQGLNGSAVAEICGKNGMTEAKKIIDALPELQGPASPDGASLFSSWAASLKWESKEWERRQAVAYIFGIHPLFALVCPELTEEKLLELSSLATDLEFTSEGLDDVIAQVTG